MPEPVGRVAGLWRYPVKSLQGEACASVQVVGDGVAGDRSFGILDLSSGTVLSAKREGGLLSVFARLVDGVARIALDEGEELAPGARLDAALSEWLGRPVRLVAASEFGAATYEGLTDFEREDSELGSWVGPPGRFVDSRPVHVLTTASLAACAAERPELDWSPRRFRPNVLVETESAGFVEQGWVGRRLHLGEVVLDVEKPCSRCVMTTRSQPDGLERQLDILRHLNGVHETNLGVLATVAVPGTVRLGDHLELGD